MKKLVVVALLAAVFGAPQKSVFAAEMIEEGRWYLTPMGTFVFREDKARFSNVGPGLHLGLARGFGNNLGVEVSFIGNELSGDNLQTIGQYGFGVDLIKAFETSSSWSPYVVLGTGYLKTRSNEEGNPLPVGLDYDNVIGSVAVGVGHQLGNTSGMFRTELRYRADFADETYGDFLFNIGFSVPLGPTAAPPVILDSDNDGVLDPEDLCPGTASGAPVDANGCELDSDKDGVVNSRDKCANTSVGTAVDSMGCAKMKDADRDGVADAKDRCPNTPAGAKVNTMGCSDDDNDGILNNVDQCPNTVANARVDARGCEIKAEIRLPGVEFETNSAKLTPSSSAVLDSAVASLKKYMEITVEAEGHTDSSGKAAYNMSLSQRRAESVRDYIISKGIDASRITARGFGETSPIATNETREGRQSNRRVTLRLTNE